MNIKDYLGLTSGSLTVVDLERKRSKSGRSILYYVCNCSCGGTHTIKADIFRIGDCSSCPNCRKSSKFLNGRTRKNINRYFKTIKSRCKKNKIDLDFDVSFISELLNKQNNLCSLSGLPISIEDGTASIDRINNSIGYLKNNVQWVHRSINYMKNELEQDKFIELCLKVSSFYYKNQDLLILRQL